MRLSIFHIALILLPALLSVAQATPAPTGERCEETSTCIALTAPQRIQLASDLGTWLQALANTNHFSGGITVGLEGQELFTITQGIAKTTSPTPILITEDTRFPLASLTKTFVAALIWKRINQGLITLDTPISTLVPWLQAPDVSETFWNQVTIGQLLSHTSLIPDIVDNTTPLDGDTVWNVAIAQNWNADQMIQEAQGLPPLSAPAYSNVGYSILGRALEHPSLNGGQALTLASIIQTELLNDPATQLSDSGVMTDNQVDDTFAFPSLGTLWDTTVTLRKPALFFASGDLYGSIRDLGRWGCALFSGASVIPPSSLPGFWEAATPPTGSTSTSNTYGANSEVLDSFTLVYKSAGFPDLRDPNLPYAYSHILVYVPELSLTFGFLQNGSGWNPLAAARLFLHEAGMRLAGNSPQPRS